MKFLDFLKQVKSEKIFPQNNFCFVGNYYSFLFFQKLFHFYKSYLPAKYQNLIVDSVDKNEIHVSLTQTFLGEKYFYWLGDVSTFKNIEYLLNYKAPHYIAFYLDKEKLPKNIDNNFNIIEIEEKINFQLFTEILAILEIKISPKKLILIKKFFLNSSESFNLDQVSMLINYIDLIKIEDEQVVTDYLAVVLNNGSPALNLLATYFFEKKPIEFFKIWSIVADEYPDMFWISFWSEKIYKAYFMVNFLNKNDHIQAKTLSFGLPYSFIKGEWKKTLPNILSNYHDFLYTNDFKVKTGSTFCFMDLFYLNHFSC